MRREPRPPGAAAVVSPDPPIPDVALLETALALLTADLDAEEIGRGDDDAHRRAALLAHLAAWATFMHDTVAQRDAAMSAPEEAKLHADADASVADAISTPETQASAV